MSKKDYPELEGKEILWTSDNGSRTMKAKVLGCNYDIGLTIVAAENEKRKLTCLNGPSSSNPSFQTSHKACFYAGVAMIKKGHYKVAVDDKIEKSISGKTFNGLQQMNS